MITFGCDSRSFRLSKSSWDVIAEKAPANVYNSIISYTNSTKDFMVPSIWGSIPKGEDPYVVQTSGGKLNPTCMPPYPKKHADPYEVHQVVAL